MNNDKNNLVNEIMRLKESNNNLLNRIKSIAEANEKIKKEVDRRDKINGVIRKNKRNIERSLNSFNTNSTYNNNNLNITTHSALINGFNKDNSNSPLIDKSAISYSPQINNNLNISN